MLKVIDPSLPGAAVTYWQADTLIGGSLPMALARLAERFDGLLVVWTEDVRTARQLYDQLNFFLTHLKDEIMLDYFPADGLLLYDHFLPDHQTIAKRLALLARLPHLKKRGVLVCAMTTAMHQLPPLDYLARHGFVVRVGDVLNRASLSEQLAFGGYTQVSKLMQAGEWRIAGGVMDVFPLGSRHAYRMDWFGDSIDAIYQLDETCTKPSGRLEAIECLPHFEFPLHLEACQQFCARWVAHFGKETCDHPRYRNVQQGQSAPGLQYDLPLFFEQPLASLLDYLPKATLCVTVGDVEAAAAAYWKLALKRHEAHRLMHPCLSPSEILLPVQTLFQALRSHRRISVCHRRDRGSLQANVQSICAVPAATSCVALLRDLQAKHSAVLLIVGTEGRCTYWVDVMAKQGVTLTIYPHVDAFLEKPAAFGIVVGHFKGSFSTKEPDCVLISEHDVLTYTDSSPDWLKSTEQSAYAQPSSGTSLHLKAGDFVVHRTHGIGRFVGMQALETDGQKTEYMLLEYAKEAKLYVPIYSMHLITPYQVLGGSVMQLDTLGGSRWKKLKIKANKEIRDVAAELLEAYAKRSIASGYAYHIPADDYARFVSEFPYRETPDQTTAIVAVLHDMKSKKTMDRLLCGDTGFGKTEVAMRAAFIAVQNHKQVAILVPTTLLAKQHFGSFQDRFAHWPIKIGLLSRMVSQKNQRTCLEGLRQGQFDIVIGTHRLAQPDIIFHDLGLLVIDEEHRFGVRHKEHIRRLATGIDILSMSATPIPRTLSLSFSELRDLSIIATPPEARLSIKTTVEGYDQQAVREAIVRELTRGGQVYYIYNRVGDIEHKAEDLARCLPEARIAIGHGQMKPHALEKTMLDFHAQRSNVLLATTILEAGIDIPNANTIIIERADRFGLAQLHQLRGRVGRSHHQAYAYLLTPPEKRLMGDVKRRLSAMSDLESIGAGFLLAEHDLEIRGAGHLLGKAQSGHMQAIGFSLYMEWLEQAAASVQSGETFDLSRMEGAQQSPIHLKITALLPDDYISDVAMRLRFYQRLVQASDLDTLDAIRVEMIDQFGALPDEAENLWCVHRLRCQLIPWQIERLHLHRTLGVIHFTEKSPIDVDKLMRLVGSSRGAYQLKGAYMLQFAYPPGQICDRTQGREVMDWIPTFFARFLRYI